MLKIIKTHRGAAMIETIIAFPVLLMLGLGIVHVGLIFQAKSNLEYAALMAARYAASELDEDAFNTNDLEDIIWHRMKASRYHPDDVMTQNDRDGIFIEVIGPTEAMFFDFGVNSLIDGTNGQCPMTDCIIPNDNLINRSTDPGDTSLVSIQDANILRLKVTYRLDTKVPLMRPFFITKVSEPGLPSGTDIVSTAIVRMQVPARAQGSTLCLYDGVGC